MRHNTPGRVHTMVGYTAKGRIKALGLFDHLGLYHKSKRPLLVRWETAAEYPADELFDDPVFDPLGSYTGTPEDGGEPEQDADDL